jgi:hypothetical protein
MDGTTALPCRCLYFSAIAFKDADMTITAQCCCGNHQDQLSWVSLSMPMGGVIMMHYSACPHDAHRTQDIMWSMCWHMLDHPPYSMNLSLCDLLSGWRFGPNKDLRAVVVRWFQQQGRCFCEGIYQLVCEWYMSLNAHDYFNGPELSPKQMLFAWAS